MHRFPGLELVRAAAELLRARLMLARLAPDELAAIAELEPPTEAAPAASLDPQVARIAWLVPRVAARLPWRADCLVQALAARRWLAALGQETSLHLGASNDGGRFEAHAWLSWKGLVVTGGSIEAYAPLTRPRPVSSEP